MFGTMGFSELIIILVIVLIIFGAGKLPQIGEGFGKALKGFKKEVHEVPPPPDTDAPQEAPALPSTQQASPDTQTVSAPTGTQAGSPPTAAATGAASNVPYTPGPERTPGTTAAMTYAAGPQAYQPRQQAAQSEAQAASTAAQQAPSPGQPPTMEERMAEPAPVARASYPALPSGAKPKPGAKRPSAVVNKDAVARVQAQQAAMKQAGTQKKGAATPQDMQQVGEGLGDALRTFRQAAADVRGAIEPEMRNLKAEMDSAQKEIEQSVEAAKQMPAVQEDPPRST